MAQAVTKMEHMNDYFVEPSERTLMDNVMRLPFKYKSVIHLFYYEDYSVKEIAGILQINESAVKMRLQRGRKAARMDLEGEDD